MKKRISNLRWWETGEPCALTVENGIVVERGDDSSSQVDTTVDMQGKFLMPAFIDAHCHILPTGLDLQKLHLGNCNAKSDVLDAVSAWISDHPGDGWIHAVHYDQTKFSDGEHLTRNELDRINSSRPILLRHVNGHASIANSGALLSANVTESVEDPAGGVYCRDSAGKLSGVLLERAHEFVTNAAPHPTLAEMVDAILAAGEKMSQLGITCATDMMTGRWNLQEELTAYRVASERGCKTRLRLYLQWGTVLGSRGISSDLLKELTDSMSPSACAVRGLKIFADGAIASATAAIYGNYQHDGGNGQLIYTPERLRDMVKKGHDAGWSIAIHSIGDRSTDHVLDAFERTGESRRHRLEHAMLMSDEQIQRLKNAGCHTTMQPEFLMRFGHAYHRQLGPERAAKIKRFRSVLNAGVSLSFSSDRPIVGGNPWNGILSAEERPAGFDADENITRQGGIMAYTKGGAVANWDTDCLGTLSVGEYADFQLYDEDPLKAQHPAPTATYKSGELVGS